MKNIFYTALRFILKYTQRLLLYLYDELTTLGVDLYEKLIDDGNQDAKFGAETDIASRYHKGFTVSVNRRLSKEDSFKNLALFGQIGSGKTTRYIIPSLISLLDQPCSIIVNDPAHQCHEFTSGYGQKKGVRILILNWLNPEISVPLNLLKACKNYTEVKRLADVLVRSANKGAKTDPFWMSQSKMVIAVFMLLALLQEDTAEHNLVTVSRFLGKFIGGEEKEIDLLVAEATDNPEGTNLYADYMKVVAIPEKTRQNVMASVFAVMEIFEDPKIAKVVSAQESFNWDELRRVPTILYIQNSVGSSKYLDVLNSCVYELLYAHLLERIPKDDELDLFMIYEEFSSMYIPMIPAFLANNRKHRIGNFLCLQSESQLDHYGADKLNITANCVTHVVLPGDHPISFLKELQEKSGTVTYVDDKGHREKKSLIPLAEFRLWDTDTALVIQGNRPFVKVKTKPFYKSHKLSHKTKLPPAKAENLQPKRTREVSKNDPGFVRNKPISSDGN